MTRFLREPAVQVSAAGGVSGSVTAPPSKSLTNRVLLVAALAMGTSRLRGTLRSDDADAMVRAARAFGATVSVAGDVLVVEGVDGAVRSPAETIDAGLSGTTLRFATAVAALGAAATVVGGSAPLLRRPVGPLTAALRSLGAVVDDAGGFPPVTVRGPLAGGSVAVDVSSSSQFASALLLAAPYAQHDVVVTADGAAADAYVEMTVDVIRRWGAAVTSPTPRQWHVAAGHGYVGREETVEYDASAAAHLFALAAATGGTVTVTNAAPATLQPDAGIVHVLEAMGCTVRRDGASVNVTGPVRLRAADVNLASMPDQLPTIAALAALAQGTTRITGAAVTRGHETDRIAAAATELRKLGVQVVEAPDGVAGTGGVTAASRLHTYDDHRLAMAFAALALRVPGVVIADPGCVAKTYPGFWDDLMALGAVVRPAD